MKTCRPTGVRAGLQFRVCSDIDYLLKLGKEAPISSAYRPGPTPATSAAS